MQDSSKSERERLENWERRLGLSIRQERQRVGLSQAEVAERMSARGFSVIQTTIAKIEAGTRPLRISEFVGIAHALGTTWHSLLAVSDSVLEEDDPLAHLEARLNRVIALEDQIREHFAEELNAFRETMEQILYAYSNVRATRESIAVLQREGLGEKRGAAANADQ